MNLDSSIIIDPCEGIFEGTVTFSFVLTEMTEEQDGITVSETLAVLSFMIRSGLSI